MNAYLRTLSLLFLSFLLSACGTTDTAMQEAGRSEAFVQGFHDGRHSGMQEAGNTWEHYIKDHERYQKDSEYREGWLAGEAEGKRLQQQAASIGNAAAGAYGGYQVNKEVKKHDPDKVAKDAVKGVDTKGLEALEK